ncbi:MAG: insulinase family protein [Acidobacteria bacterium]|nr:insulinase family protein [Acidobacteriota bacterium]
MKIRWLLFLLAFNATLAQSVQNLSFPPLNFKPPQAAERQLQNGMTVFLLEDHELPTISAFAMIRTGGIYEPADKLGLAELTGAVMRSGGTRALSPLELNERLEFIAASVETSIGDEFGQATFSVLKKDLENGLELFSSVLREPAFDPAQFELSREQLREGIRRRNDFPSSIVSREYTKLVYGADHPLARTVEMTHLDRIQREDLAAFHQKYFHPNNIILGVSGDFDSDEMMVLLEKHLGDWKPVTIDFPEVAGVSTELNPSLNYIAKDINQTNIRLGHLGIKQSNPDYFAVTVMDTILGGGFSSRLFRTIRSEQALAYSVGSHFGAGMREYGIFSVFLETAAGSTLRAVQSSVEQIRRMRETPVTPEELEIAKESVLNSFVFAFDNPAEIVNRQVRYRFFALPSDYLEKYRDRVASVSAQDVLDAARKYLNPDRLTILAVGPETARKALFTLGGVRELPLETAR